MDKTVYDQQLKKRGLLDVCADATANVLGLANVATNIVASVL